MGSPAVETERSRSGKCVRVVAFTDGLSHTVVFSERLKGSGRNLAVVAPKPGDIIIMPGRRDAMLHPDPMMSQCASFDGSPSSFHFNSAGRWLRGSDWSNGWPFGFYSATLYNHVAPPNWRHLDCGSWSAIPDAPGNTPSLSARSAPRGRRERRPGRRFRAFCGRHDRLESVGARWALATRVNNMRVTSTDGAVHQRVISAEAHAFDSARFGDGDACDGPPARTSQQSTASSVAGRPTRSPASRQQKKNTTKGQKSTKDSEGEMRDAGAQCGDGNGHPAFTAASSAWVNRWDFAFCVCFGGLDFVGGTAKFPHTPRRSDAGGPRAGRALPG